MIMAKRTTREMKDSCSSWIEGNYINWRNSQPIGEDSITKYAELLNVPRTALAHWLAGDSIPENDNVIKLANRLGGEIYDILEWERPKEMPPDVTSDTASSPLVTDYASPNTTTTKRKQKIKSAPDNAINLLTGGG